MKKQISKLNMVLIFGLLFTFSINSVLAIPPKYPTQVVEDIFCAQSQRISGFFNCFKLGKIGFQCRETICPPSAIKFTCLPYPFLSCDTKTCCGILKKPTPENCIALYDPVCCNVAGNRLNYPNDCECKRANGNVLNKGNCEIVIPECTTTKECQDKYRDCYYNCGSDTGKCNQIRTFVGLTPYPECKTIESQTCINTELTLSVNKRTYCIPISKSDALENMFKELGRQI